MLDKILRHKYKHPWQAKWAAAFVAPFDYIRLLFKGEKILSQKYTVFRNYASDDSYGYSVMRIIITKGMRDDLLKQHGFDYAEDLINELNNMKDDPI